MKIRRMSAGGLIFLLGGMGHASESVDPAGWTGSGELGLAFARGNARSETINGKIALGTESEQWKHDLGLQVLRVKGEQDDAFELTANRYELTGSSGYKFDTRRSVIGSLRYENDDFAPFEYQAVASISYGYRMIDSETTKLGLQIGPGFRRAKDRGTAEVEGDAVLRGRLDYSHQLTETSLISETLLIEATGDNSFIQNDLGIAVKINASLALKSALQVRHNTDVSAGIEKTDTLVTTNVVFSF